MAMATLVDYGPEEAAMQRYLAEGEARVLALGNRGPIRFTADGKLHPEIVEAYERCGFYVFENVISPGELTELEAEFHDMVERLPAEPGSAVDRKGRPALGADRDVPVTMWSKPLGDPLGGTQIANGRHVTKMFEPKPAPELPDKIAFVVVSPMQYSEASLRLYGHPGLLRVAAAVNGDDFTPFNEVIIIKKPGEGASFSWHQDGTTHWDAPDWDEHTHGFNFMAQLYGSTAATGVWYVPGSHKLGKLDIKAIVEDAGGERLPQAVPMLSKPGDVAISNRQVIHGSFANTSPDWRVTFNIGFHRRRSVLGATGYVIDTNEPATYDDEWIRKRSELIGYAIDARRRHFPDETPFVYQPHARAGERYVWDEAARSALRGYNKLDLVI
jgi:ectoine hydroxylase-related dioxygenase (phytanoyl-CoA dioxygenase family)